MATVYPNTYKDKPGVKRDNEPMARPFVKLRDGTLMTYDEWLKAKNPG